MIPFRDSEPLPDQLDFLSRCSGAFLRLLLKGMQDVDRVLETDSINGPVSVPVVGCHDLQDSAPRKTFECFDG